MWSTLPPMNQRTAMWSLRSTTWSFAPPKNGSPRMFFSADRAHAGRKPATIASRAAFFSASPMRSGRRDGGAQVLDVLHHPLVARRLEVVGRMEAVAAADQHEYGVGLRERRLSRQLEDWQAAVGRLLLHRGPRGGVDAHVLEVDAGEVQGEAALLAAAHGGVEVDQLGLGHVGKRTTASRRQPQESPKPTDKSKS